jgi:predicted nucleotidyltransferase
MTPNEELAGLARVLAQWVAPAPRATIYLFGSRVRGDHRPDSDVDIVIHFDKPTHEDVVWWDAINSDLFQSIDAKLPGKLKILENADPISGRVRAAREVHRDGRVICVWMDPKPGSRARGRGARHIRP